MYLVCMHGDFMISVGFPRVLSLYFTSAKLGRLTIFVIKMKLNLVILASGGAFGGILRRRLCRAPLGRGRFFRSASLA